MANDQLLRERITDTVCASLRPIPDVLAGWEGGSAAFDALDEYSDIDLNFLVNDEASLLTLYTAVAESLETISPIVMTHDAPPGRESSFCANSIHTEPNALRAECRSGT